MMNNIETTKNPTDAISYAESNDYVRFLLEQEDADYFQNIFINEWGVYIITQSNSDVKDNYSDVSTCHYPKRPVSVQRRVTVWSERKW